MPASSLIDHLAKPSGGLLQALRARSGNYVFCLALLGIRHQRSMLHCPWQNGRIERFFGTFKSYADKVFFNAKYLQASLDEFALWYNEIRPHRHLGGKTPCEVWNGTDPYSLPLKSCRKFSAWNGLLRGYRMEYG